MTQDEYIILLLHQTRATLKRSLQEMSVREKSNLIKMLKEEKSIQHQDAWAYSFPDIGENDGSWMDD